DAACGESGGGDEESGARNLCKAAVPKIAEAVDKGDELAGGGEIDAAFVGYDACLALGFGEVEFKSDETLAGAWFQVLENVLVTGVVGNDELKAGRGFDELAGFFHRQHAAMV